MTSSTKEITKLELENKFLKYTLTTHIEPIETVDKLSSWFLAAAGISAGLITSHILDLSKILELDVIRDILLILTISGLLGCAAKLKYLECASFKIQNNKSLNEEENLLNAISENREAFDLDYVFYELRSIIPWFHKYKFPENLRNKKSKHNPIKTLKEAALSYYWQYSYTILQIIAFIIFTAFSI